jgi:hypothetical protein
MSLKNDGFKALNRITFNSISAHRVYRYSEPCRARLSLQEPPAAPEVQAVPENLKKVPPRHFFDKIKGCVIASFCHAGQICRPASFVRAGRTLHAI